MSQRPELDSLDSLAALSRWRNRIVADRDKYGYAGGCPLGSMANELADGDPQTQRRAAAVSRGVGGTVACRADGHASPGKANQARIRLRWQRR